MRTLKIQLRPDELGVVTVEMRLSNGQLETHLRASQPETAALLHKDTAILTDLLNQVATRPSHRRAGASDRDGDGIRIRRVAATSLAVLHRRGGPPRQRGRPTAPGRAAPGHRQQTRRRTDG